MPVSSSPSYRHDALTVVGTAHYPWQLVVEEDCSDIVQMAVQGEETAASLVRPDLDLIVVASRDEPVPSSACSSRPIQYPGMLTVAASYGSQRHGLAHRALRSGQSRFPYGNPIIELWRNVATRGSMA